MLMKLRDFLKTRFGEHRRAVIANDASQLVAGPLPILVAFVPFLVAKIAVKDMKCISFQFGTAHSLMHVFRTFIITCPCSIFSDMDEFPLILFLMHDSLFNIL